MAPNDEIANNAVGVNNAAVVLTADERMEAIETQLTTFGGHIQTLMIAMQALLPVPQQPAPVNLAPVIQQPAPVNPVPVIQQQAPVATAATDRRRHLDPSNLAKLSADVTLVQLQSWRRGWDDYACLSGLSSLPVMEQGAILRLTFDSSMRQVVEIALGILPTDSKSPDEVLDSITAYIRAKRNVALDRVAFRECCQSATESFDDFYMRLKSLAGPAQLCGACTDEQMAEAEAPGPHSNPRPL